MVRKLALLLAVGLVAISFSKPAHAVPIQLVNNGEFELPGVGSNTWAGFANGVVPGWASTGVAFEIWGSNFTAGASLPALGTDGLAHGQHHEINYSQTTDYTTQGIAPLSQAGTVDFSFDTWRRDATSISYNVIGSIQGILVSNTFNYNGSNQWHNISESFSVLAGETLNLGFTAAGSGCCGAHIDQVSMIYNASQVPEPSTYLLLSCGIAGLIFYRRKLQAL